MTIILERITTPQCLILGIRYLSVAPEYIHKMVCFLSRWIFSTSLIDQGLIVTEMYLYLHSVLVQLTMNSIMLVLAALWNSQQRFR